MEERGAIDGIPNLMHIIWNGTTIYMHSCAGERLHSP